MNKPDFGGYVTKNDLLCSDGRTIRKDAFKHHDNGRVPLVWQHFRDSPENVLGHVVLENRNDGVYGYGYFNNTEQGKNAKEYVQHGDINALSIHAHKLVQNGSDVLHGVITEVSLVLAGANPGAFIDTVAFDHSDDSEAEAIIYSGEMLEHSMFHESKPTEPDTKEIIEHEEKNVPDSKEKTVQDVIDTFDEDQKIALEFIIGSILEEYGIDPDKEMKQSAEGDDVARNVFDSAGNEYDEVLTHGEFLEAIETAKEQRITLKNAFLEHGIRNIGNLYPDSKPLAGGAQTYARDMAWVGDVLSNVNRAPFSKFRTTWFDLTADEARAKGYIKGNQKQEEFFSSGRRFTMPTTIYKKQSFDRDDVLDITDMDIVAYIKEEMSVMLREAQAKQVLVGDGKPVSDQTRIDPTKFIPVAEDVYFFNTKFTITETGVADWEGDVPQNFTSETEALMPSAPTPTQIEDAILRMRPAIKGGTGSPMLFVSESVSTELFLQKDRQGRRIYRTMDELAASLRVSKIVELPDSEFRKVVAAGANYAGQKLVALMFNPADYTIGADKGGNATMFDDFDIDFNKYKYLLETRCSGMLRNIKSAASLYVKVA